VNNDLDPDAAATLRKLRDVLDQIKHLEEEANAYKTLLRGKLGVGQYTVNGQPAVTISPTKRFDPDKAAEILPPAAIEGISKTVIDAALAKKTLPPALYALCQSETGKPTVRPI
jgi:hypothetical protein